MEIGDLMSAMRHLVRIPMLFNTYRGVLEDTCFRVPEHGIYMGSDHGELPQLWIWQALKKYYDEQQTAEAPSKSMLAHYINEIFRSGVYVDDDLRYLMLDEPSPTEGYLAFLYDDVELNHRTGVPLIRSFLEERVIQYGLSKINTFGMDDKPISERLTELTETARRIDTAGFTYDALPVIPDAEYLASLPEERPAMTTGVDWVDRSLGGGQRPGECYAIMGATGAGKTTLGIQLAVKNTEAAYNEAFQTGRHPDLVLYYTFEESASAQMQRILSAGARVRRDRTEFSRRAERGLIRPVSTCLENAYEYERRRWPNGIAQFEADRLNDFSRVAHESLFVRNFSGVADIGDSPEMAALKQNIGRGGVPEVMMDAKRLADQFKTGIRSIFIDYVGLLCLRQADYDNERYYAKLRSVGDEIRMLLAGRLNCTGWVLHQLSGVANSRTPLRKPSLADGEGCKTLPVNMQACWVLGTPDKSNPRTCGGPRLYCVAVKQRNAGCTDVNSGIILQHDEDFVQLNNVTDRFRPNPRTQGFELRRSDAAWL